MITARAKMINAQRDVEIAQLKGLAEQNKKKQSVEEKIKQLKREKYTSSSFEKYPRDIHYSKLLVDEKKKSPEKQGILYIQSVETGDINKIEKIEEKYSLKNNLFIDPGLNIEELDEESNFESNQEESVDISKKPLPAPNIGLDVSFKTLKRSFQYSNIPKKYHTVLTVLNWSIQDYYNLSGVYEKFLKKDDPLEEKSRVVDYILKSLIEDSTYQQIGGNKESKDNSEPIVYNKVSRVKRFKNFKKFKQKLKEFYDTIKKIQKISTNVGDIESFDSKTIFFIFYDLLVNKSFWILIPEKNKSFLNFLCSRMFEIIDESNDEVIHLIKANEANQTVEEKGPTNLVKSIVKKYHKNISPEKLERIVNVILNLNNLKKDEAVAENLQLKIVTGSKYKQENSWSSKWRQISQKDKNKLFNLFHDEEDLLALSTILFAIGSKGLIQYLLSLVFIYFIKIKN